MQFYSILRFLCSALGEYIDHLHLVEEVQQKALGILLDANIDRITVEVLHRSQKWKRVHRLPM